MCQLIDNIEIAVLESKAKKVNTLNTEIIMLKFSHDSFKLVIKLVIKTGYHLAQYDR